MYRLFTMICVLALSACTTLAPGAADVRVTSHSSEVTQCRPAGAVSVPYNPIPANTIGLATNQVVALQADTLLVTQSFPAFLGVAYRCGGGS